MDLTIKGIHLNLNDLEDIEPELTESLTWMTKNNVNELEQPFIYEIDFFGTMLTEELVENGSNKLLNEENKDLYIRRLYLAKTFKEVETQVELFKQGFFEIVPKNLLDIFSSGEVGILISGTSEIDVQDLIRHTVCKGINRTTQRVQWFWEIIQGMDQIMLANLLFFITG